MKHETDLNSICLLVISKKGRLENLKIYQEDTLEFYEMFDIFSR